MRNPNYIMSTPRGSNSPETSATGSASVLSVQTTPPIRTGTLVFVVPPSGGSQPETSRIPARAGTTSRLCTFATLLLLTVSLLPLRADDTPSVSVLPGDDAPYVPDPKQVGGEADSVVQVANLIYAGVKSSQCFSDHFLGAAERDSAISTSRRFHAVKLSSDEVFNFPMVIMTGEGEFRLTPSERENLRQYLDRGGFLLASAGCSSKEWNRSFRAEIAALYPDNAAVPLAKDHPVFHTIHHIESLKAKHGTPKPLEGVTHNGRLCIIYSEDGLNDTSHAQGCCCCGGNEITNCIDVNVNILAYALLF